MRLLNAKTKRLEQFDGDEIPRYAILSHTWGKIEVTFQDIEQSGYQGGSTKIDGCCSQALVDKLEYAWIDTCCIDKSSSSELSEAINSMWSWYKNADICYAYLADVPPGDRIEEEEGPAFRRSRWFTRGWTLQELIGPETVNFYDMTWAFLGEKSGSKKSASFVEILTNITSISAHYLRHGSAVRYASIARRMSWAAGRDTTRVEDKAYSLLGIFDVNMPMLYGEGERAFKRLQEEIMKESDDESIFAWGIDKPTNGAVEVAFSLLASSPADFSNCGNIIPSIPKGIHSAHYYMTNKGLYIQMSTRDLPIDDVSSLALLNCTFAGATDSKSLALPLILSQNVKQCFSRPGLSTPVLVSSELFSLETRTKFYIHRNSPDWVDLYTCGFRVKSWLHGEATILDPTEFYPPTWRTILSHGFIWRQPGMMGRQQQSILFLVETPGWPNIATRIDYTFHVDNWSLSPGGLQCRAAFTDASVSLAEIMIRSSANPGGIGDALDWQESLEVKDGQLGFSLDKPERNDSEEPWILNIEVCKKETKADTISP